MHTLTAVCVGVCCTQPSILSQVLSVFSNCSLEIQLKQKHPGNLVCAKLIAAENFMDDFGDSHDEPNIDVSYLRIKGKLVQLPSGVQLRQS